MIRRAFILLAGLAAALPVRADVIYEVPEATNKVAGAWDVNILADDVHFSAPSVIRQVRLRLAIAGTQTCRLWIFTMLNSPPIYTAVFTNVPASSEYNVSTYDFDMQLQVPRDIYVGFSAQGGGWNAPTNTDYWTRGYTVSRGVAGTPGVYYYGLVSGGQLTASYSAGDTLHGCMQIVSEPVRLDGISVVTGQVQLAIAPLPVHGTNTLEWNAAAGSTNWAAVEDLPAGASNHVWSGTAPATSAFYRVKTR